MRGDLVCVRLAGSDTGRSAGLDCLTVSGSVRRRLRRLPLRKSLGFPASWGAPDVPSEMSTTPITGGAFGPLAGHSGCEAAVRQRLVAPP
jgi:hypothetical protein